MNFFETYQDWIAMRCGKLTASEIGKLLKGGTRPMTKEELLAREKGNTRKTVDTIFGDGALTYINTKVHEIISGEVKELSGIPALEWGASNEVLAIDFYKNATGNNDVIHYGMHNPKFVLYNAVSGGSPDAETKTHSIEVKCAFNGANHITVLKHAKSKIKSLTNNEFLKEYDADYYAQIQFNMLIGNKELGAFISYDPRILKEDLKGSILEIETDKEHQLLIQDRIEKATEIIANDLELFGI